MSERVLASMLCARGVGKLAFASLVTQTNVIVV